MKHRTDTLIHKTLHILEKVLALLTLAVLIVALAMDLWRMFTIPDYFPSVEAFLHDILTLVVGLEFVRMLVDMTPGNTLEVLIVAISRHVILSHDNPWSNIACVACIAGLFAVRRWLIPKQELHREFSTGQEPDRASEGGSHENHGQ